MIIPGLQNWIFKAGGSSYELIIKTRHTVGTLAWEAFAVMSTRSFDEKRFSLSERQHTISTPNKNQEREITIKKEGSLQERPPGGPDKTLLVRESEAVVICLKSHVRGDGHVRRGHSQEVPMTQLDVRYIMLKRVHIVNGL